MSCLIQFTAIRRTLFTNQQRIDFLHHLMVGIRSILQGSHGLKDGDNFHEFCRLLARVKTNFQLNEILSNAGYEEFIDRVAQFTVTSLYSTQWSTNSLHYILGVWEQLVLSLPYTKPDSKPHKLHEYCPNILEAYIVTRLNLVSNAEFSKTMLEDLSTLETQLKQVAVIARAYYAATKACIVRLMQPLLGTYSQMVPQLSALLHSPNVTALYHTELCLTWLVYIIGAIIGARMEGICTDTADELDGELVRRLKLRGGRKK